MWSDRLRVSMAVGFTDQVSLVIAIVSYTDLDDRIAAIFNDYIAAV